MINLHPARFVNKRTSSYSISDRTFRSVTCTISKHIIKSMHAPKKIKTIYNFWTDAEYVGFVSVINATYIIFKCIIKIICVMKKLKAVYSNIERTQHTDVACGTVHLYVHSRETKVRWWRRPYRYIFRFHACGAHGQGSATVVDWPSLSWSHGHGWWPTVDLTYHETSRRREFTWIGTSILYAGGPKNFSRRRHCPARPATGIPTRGTSAPAVVVDDTTGWVRPCSSSDPSPCSRLRLYVQ
jgi:hypothetical protein